LTSFFTPGAPRTTPDSASKLSTISSGAVAASSSPAIVFEAPKTQPTEWVRRQRQTLPDQSA
jgi:hypothetical protein